MACDAQVLLHFAELRGLDGHEGVLLAVDGAGLQGGENLTEGHGHGIGAQRLERVQEDVVLHDAHFHAIEVFHFGNRPFAVGQVAKAIFPVGQVNQAGVFQFLVEELAGGAVQHRIGFLFVGKQERQVKRAQLLHDAHQG